MKITRSNAAGEIPRQIFQPPLEPEVINVNEVDGYFSVVSWSGQSITPEVD